MITRGLTIIVPFYNTNRQMLKKCVESIISSSNKDFELIIINDGTKLGEKDYS